MSTFILIRLVIDSDSRSYQITTIKCINPAYISIWLSLVFFKISQVEDLMRQTFRVIKKGFSDVV